MKRLVVFVVLGIVAVWASQAEARDGRNECVRTTFQGPEFASLIYTNSCNKPIVAKVCSKYLIAELWNAVNGDPIGGSWTCSGTRLIQPNAYIDVRITAIRESSIARKALAENSYRIFTCEPPLKPVIQNTEATRYVCELDPADREPNWDEAEFARLTQVKLHSYDPEVVLGFAPRMPDCSPDISHEIAAVFPDEPLTPRQVMTEMRRVHLGVSYSRTSNRCYLRGNSSPFVKFQFHGFVGQQKRFIINYAVNDTYRFPDHDGMVKVATQALEQTGLLADECSPEFRNDLVGLFRNSKTSADTVIEEMRKAHSNPVLNDRIRACLAENRLPRSATFTFRGADLNGDTVVALRYNTSGLQAQPNFNALRSEIESQLQN